MSIACYQVYADLTCIIDMILDILQRADYIVANVRIGVPASIFHKLAQQIERAAAQPASANRTAW